MSTLYLDRKNLTVTHQSGRLRLSAPDEPPRDVPIALLERVVIHARVSLDTTVLAALADAGVGTTILSPRQGRRVAIVQGRPHNDLRVRLAQFERLSDGQWRLAWSRRLVTSKLRAQRRVVGDMLARRPDARRPLSAAAATLDRALSQVAAAGEVDSLRGHEGAAAAAYFEALPAVFPQRLGFSGRNRRPPRDPVNAVLSLAYTLAHYEAVHAAYGAGLDPYLGYYHRPAFGRESLACDLLEPLRPRLDAWAWRLFAERTLRFGHFRRDKRACLLDKTGRSRFYRAYEAACGPRRRALRRSVRRLARYLREHTMTEIADDDDDEAALS